MGLSDVRSAGADLLFEKSGGRESLLKAVAELLGSEDRRDLMTCMDADWWASERIGLPPRKLNQGS